MSSFCGRWGSPWGIDADEPIPGRVFLFPKGDMPAPPNWAVGDFFQHNGVFYNGMRGEGSPCHSDSYMTLVSYTRLASCLDLLQRTYEPARTDWQVLTDAWLGNPNTQPPMRLVAFEICNRFGIEKATVDQSKWK